MAHKNFSEKDVTVKSLPCSIILQEGNIKEERIDLNKTTDLFLNVFIRSEGSFTIEKTSEGIKFESRELFYQFIYSILSYLFFLSPKSDISLYMREQSDETTVSFLINGMNISSKKELLVYSDKFFKSHGNVFILDINQVFYLLKQKGFRCKVVRDKDMFIIKLNKSKIQKNSDMKNVISIKREKR